MSGNGPRALRAGERPAPPVRAYWAGRLPGATGIRGVFAEKCASEAPAGR